MSRAVQVESLIAGLVDASGDPLAGGLVYSYEAGTTTEKALYSDQGMTTEHTNPLVLDARGRALAFAEGAYKFVVKDSEDVTQFTLDVLQYVSTEENAVYAGTSSGSSNAYSVTSSPAITELTDGLVISFIANHASIAATPATLNPSALGAYAFVRVDGTTDIDLGDILVDQLVDAKFIESSNHFRLVSQAGVQNISQGGTGASTAAVARDNLGVTALFDDVDTALDGKLSNIPGAIVMYGGASAPTGWLLCDGSAVNRTTYADLFAIVGVVYGVGDGSTTFNLPDFRQRFPLGKAASGTGVDLGEIGGAVDHTHTLPAHCHGMGTGADLNITSSGGHTHTIDHDHTSATTSTDGSHQHFTANSDSGAGVVSASNYITNSADFTTDFSYTLRGSATVATIGLTSSSGSHSHTLDLPNFTGSSGSTAHTHASGNIAGRIGLVTGGVDGNAAMTSGYNNPPYLVVNFIIKT